MKRLAIFAVGLSLLGTAAVSAQSYPDPRDYGQPGDHRDDHRDRRDDHRDNRDDHRDNRGAPNQWGDRDGFNHEWSQRGVDWDHQWRRGDHMPDGYWSDRRYIIDDYRHYHLTAPRRGYHWVRYADRFVLVRDRDGLVDRIVRDLLH